MIECNVEKGKMFKCIRVVNIYMFNLDDVFNSEIKCLVVTNENDWFCNRLLGQLHFDLLNKVVSKYLVVSLPKIFF